MLGSVDLSALQAGGTGLNPASGTARAAGRLSESDREQVSFQAVLRDCLEQAVAGGTLTEETRQTAQVGPAAGAGVSDGTAGDRQASAALVDFVAAHEGYSATAYRGADAQNRTIGYGHVVEAGESTAPLGRSAALGLLKSDLAGSVRSVNREFAGIPLSQSQFDALVSFSFNLGNHIWSRAPELTADIKAGASAERLRSDFLRFDHCNGRELAGLAGRRADEWNMFANGSYRTDV